MVGQMIGGTAEELYDAFHKNVKSVVKILFKVFHAFMTAMFWWKSYI